MRSEYPAKGSGELGKKVDEIVVYDEVTEGEDGSEEATIPLKIHELAREVYEINRHTPSTYGRT